MRNKIDIIIASVIFFGILIYPVSLLLWVYDLFIAYVLEGISPPFSQRFSYFFEIIKWGRFDYFAVSLIYLIMFILPIIYLFFLLMKKKNIKVLFLIPICFYLWIVIGNIFSGIAYLDFSQTFNIFRPSHIFYHENWSNEKLWTLILFGYFVIPLIPFAITWRRRDKIPFLKGFTKSKKRKKNKPRGKYGSAEVADKHTLNEMNLSYSSRQASKEAILNIFGKLDKRYIGSITVENVLTVGGQGTGKATTGSILTLLDCPVNCFVNDIKSELFQVSYIQRENLNKKPVAIDIMHTLDQYGNFRDHMCLRFNPLFSKLLIGSSLQKKQRYLDAITDSIIMNTAHDGDKFWVSKARTIFRGFLDIIVSENIEINDPYKAKGLADLKKMFVKGEKEDILQTLKNHNQKLHSDIVDATIGAVEQSESKQLSGILGTLNDATDMLSNPAIAEFFKAPKKDSFVLDIADYLTGNLDLFLICPEQELARFPQILSIFINLMRVGIKMINLRDKKDHYLLLLDEIGQLGYLECIETIYEIGRSDGFRQHLYFQSMSQIDLYKKREMLKNFKVQRYFKTSETATIKHISYLAGKYTFTDTTISKSSNLKGWNSTKSRSSTTRDSGVELFTVDQIRTLPDDEQIIFYDGEIIKCDKVYYYLDKRYLGKDQPNLTLDYNRGLIEPFVEEVKEIDYLSEVTKLFEQICEDSENGQDIDHGYYNDSKLYISEDGLKTVILDSFPEINNYGMLMNKLLDNGVFTIDTLDDEELMVFQH